MGRSVEEAADSARSESRSIGRLPSRHRPGDGSTRRRNRPPATGPRIAASAADRRDPDTPGKNTRSRNTERSSRDRSSRGTPEPSRRRPRPQRRDRSSNRDGNGPHDGSLHWENARGSRGIRPRAPMRSTTPVPSARVDRTGESKGQHSHERESDDLPHGRLLLDGLGSGARALDWLPILTRKARLRVRGLDPTHLTQFGRCLPAPRHPFDRPGPATGTK